MAGAVVPGPFDIFLLHEHLPVGTGKEGTEGGVAVGNGGFGEGNGPVQVFAVAFDSKKPNVGF